MGKPKWITQAGTLGTLQEGVFYELLMTAEDPDDGELDYKVIAGFMPPGLVMNERTGVISGKPKNLYYIRGVPFDVSEDVTNTFCCRVTTTSGQIADRTFSITITGQDAPVIVTPPQELARVIDGSYLDIDLEAYDLDLEPLSWKIVAGELPPGVSINPDSGNISGYVYPTTNTTADITVGYDAPGVGWEEYPWDHATAWLSVNYQFTVEITDGKEYAQTTYTIFVYAKNLLTADNLELTADNDTNITADLDQRRVPVLDPQGGAIVDAENPLTPIDLGIFEHDNYFAWQFKGIDFDEDPIGFGIDVSGALAVPPNLELNSATGWFYGKIIQQLVAQNDYKFGVYVYKLDDPTVRSPTVYYNITVVGNLTNAIVWTSPSDLGEIATGAISELAVSSTNAGNIGVSYSLALGSSLPQGLRLLDNGLIVGRSSFEYTSFDKGLTTFDVDVREAGVVVDEVTFDRNYVFTVEAASSDRALLATKTFVIKIVPSSFEPYESIYMRANPGQAGKNLFISIASNTDIVPGKDVYRNGDPNFGRASDARLMLLSGLNASSASDFISAMSLNHYRKVLKFGEPQVSKAYDVNQNVLYEVLYFNLVDDQENEHGSTSASIDLRNKINRTVTIDNNDVKIDSLWTSLDGVGDRIAYPNSLVNMRDRLITELGFGVREVLPSWMSSRQLDGSIIGWKPVAVLAYLKPGAGERALFNLRRRTDLNQINISFDTDRYIWDNNLSKNFNSITGEYYVSAETTFDATQGLLENSPVALVDFAVNVPFSELDGRDSDYITTVLGGLDGLVGVYANKTVVFAQQEAYGSIDPATDWLRSETFWDDDGGWSGDSGWDASSLINGYDEFNGSSKSILSLVINPPTSNYQVVVTTVGSHGYADRDWIFFRNVGGMTNVNLNHYYVKVLSASSFVLYNNWDLTDKVDGSAFGAYTTGGTVEIQNQRSGVWRLILGDDELYRLEFEQEILPDDNVLISNGFEYGGFLLKYGPTIDFGNGDTVPRFNKVEELIEGIETTFDDTQTRFISGITTYEDPDQSDKYLAFPKRDIWA